MSNSRNLSKLSVDSNGDIAAASLDNVPPSDDASALTTGTLDIARIADASVTATKLASGAAASNLGSYVTTVNGSTGAVTVQPTLVSGTNIKTVGGASLLGSGDISAGMSVDTNTSQAATNYAIGQYIFMVSGSGGGYALNSTRTPQIFNTANRQAIFQDSSNTISSGTSISGTWRVRGGFTTSGDLSTIGSSSPWYGGWGGQLVLMQRTA